MSFPRYMRYKDSGVRWLGDVPDHWRLWKLKYLAQFSGGGTPSRDKPEYWGGDIPWVSPKDMKAEAIASTEECISESGLQNSTSSLVPAGRVLMVVRSGILKHTIPIAINSVSVAMNQDMKALAFVDRGCSARYFLRWVQGLNDDLLLEWAKQGATVESIEHAYLANTVIPLPPSHEQASIVTFLNRETETVDVLISEQQRLIELLGEKRQSVITHAVTKGLHPEVPMKDSGVDWLGAIPAHWQVWRNKVLFKDVDERTTSDEGELLTVSHLTGVTPRSEKNVNMIMAETLEGYKKCLAGDLVINTMWAWMGALGVSRCDGLVSPSYNVYRPRMSGRIEAAFYDYLCRTPLHVVTIKAHSTGVWESRLRLYPEAFLDLRSPVPPIAEQVAIVDFLKREVAKIDGLMTEAESAIALLQERRTALISAAVTGKIDVRELVGSKHKRIAAA